MKRPEVNTGGMKPQPEYDKDFEVKYQTTYWGPWMIYSQLTTEFIKKLRELSDKTRTEGNDYRHNLAGNIAEEYDLTEYTGWFGDKFRPWLDAFLMNVTRQ